MSVGLHILFYSPDPGRITNKILLAGFLTYPKSDLPILPSDSGVSMLFFHTGFTVAGTVSESHRIPFYTAAGSCRITKTSTKLEIILKVSQLFYYFIKISHSMPAALPEKFAGKEDKKHQKNPQPAKKLFFD